MSRHKKEPACKTNKVLGSLVSEIRQSQEITLKQFAKTLRVTHQQLEKYEAGIDLIPIKMLEVISETLGYPIPKKHVRKIMKIRYLEPEMRTEYDDELIALYQDIFEDE
ncbi:MAG: helix-turn-helix transcriptional regulator [Rickettsiales bacterium]|nr:helix-turn-helix transcriptional regulator [Rickettsiales bacterium]